MTGAAGIRPSAEADIAAIAGIYAVEVLHGLATFEEVPPMADEMARRRRATLDLGLPHLVAEIDGVVAGYAYAGPFRPRPAYRHTVEDSLYVRPDMRRRGIGEALLGAVIGASGGDGSIRLHERHGFRHAGTLEAVGFKLGRWVDIVTMQRPLGPGSATPPQGG